MAKKSISEKVLDIFVGAVARDLSKSVIKKFKDTVSEKTSKKSLKKNPNKENTDPDLEP
jgi:hypothetical protein